MKIKKWKKKKRYIIFINLMVYKLSRFRRVRNSWESRKDLWFRGSLGSLTFEDALTSHCKSMPLSFRDREIEGSITRSIRRVQLIRSGIRAGRNLIRQDWWKPRWCYDGAAVTLNTPYKVDLFIAIFKYPGHDEAQ